MKKILSVLFILFSFSSNCWALRASPYQLDGYCPKEKPFSSLDNDNCIGCDELGSIYVGRYAKDFEICTNRETINERSRLKECPKDFPLRDYSGGCYSCDDTEAIYMHENNNCSVCSNRMVKDGYCILKTCPRGHNFRDASGSCYTCDDAEIYKPIVNTKEDCKVCANLEAEKNDETFICIPKICPPYAPIKDGGDCRECSDDNWSFTTISPEVCAQCSNREWIETQGCRLKESPFPDKPLMNGYPNNVFTHDIPLLAQTTFHDCDVTDVSTIESNCKVCPNRQWKNGKCILKYCSDKSQMEYVDSQGKVHCVPCLGEEDGYYEVSKISESECQKCSNWSYENGVCSPKSCPDGIIMYDDSIIMKELIEALKDDTNIPSEKENTIQFHCVSCNDHEGIATTLQECQKCPNREFRDDFCEWRIVR